MSINFTSYSTLLGATSCKLSMLSYLLQSQYACAYSSLSVLPCASGHAERSPSMGKLSVKLTHVRVAQSEHASECG